MKNVKRDIYFNYINIYYFGVYKLIGRKEKKKSLLELSFKICFFIFFNILLMRYI